MAVLGLCFSQPGAEAGRLSLSAERGSYLLGEPVYLRIQSDINPVPALEEGAFALVILGPGGPERIYRPPLRLRTAGSGGRRLPGMDSAAERIRFARIICEEDGLVFRKPGRYRLRLSALSDTLSIVFQAPATEADKKAYAVLSRNPGEYGLAMYLEGGDQLKEGMAIISELAASQSAYTRAASFVLASDWSQDFIAYSGTGTRSLDLQKALAWSQWDRNAGIYIPLRNAYRLQAAVEQARRQSRSAPGLQAARSKLQGFLASLSPEERLWLRSFQPSANP
ncbi:MAG: hypothetical protein ABIY63_03680 [Fibrobacteria bacterium]